MSDNQGTGPATGNPPSSNDTGAKVEGSTFVTGLTTEKAASPAPEGGKPASDKPNGEQGNQQEAQSLPGWTAATTKVLKSDPRFTAYAGKFKSLDDAVKSHMELEEKVGKMVSLPDDKATDEERAAFYARLGVPKTPTEYKLDLDPSIKADSKEVEEFKALAHSMHMTNDQANAFYKLASERAVKEIESFHKRNEEARVEVETTLKREWGPKYDEERAVLARGIRAYASKELLSDAERTGMGNSVAFLKLLHRLGQITLEDSALVRPGSARAGKQSPESILYPNQT